MWKGRYGTVDSKRDGEEEDTKIIITTISGKNGTHIYQLVIFLLLKDMKVM